MPNGNLFSTDDVGSGGPYIYYSCTSEIVWDPGVLDLPVAYVTGSYQDAHFPGYNTTDYTTRQPAEAVVTGAERGYRVVTYHAVRYGTPPLKPDPKPQGQEVLLQARWGTNAPILQPDGNTYIYEATGRYTYLLPRPLFSFTDDLPGTSTPASVDHAANNSTSPGEFDPTLL